MTELLTNACKYTPAQETITVTVSLEASRLHLGIAHTGVELAPEALSRMFDKFYRIPNNDPWKHGGTGLGLALVKRLVEQLRGEIKVKNHNRAVCFTVCLPVCRGG